MSSAPASDEEELRRNRDLNGRLLQEAENLYDRYVEAKNERELYRKNNIELERMNKVYQKVIQSLMKKTRERPELLDDEDIWSLKQIAVALQTTPSQEADRLQKVVDDQRERIRVLSDELMAVYQELERVKFQQLGDAADAIVNSTARFQASISGSTGPGPHVSSSLRQKMQSAGAGNVPIDENILFLFSSAYSDDSKIDEFMNSKPFSAGSAAASPSPYPASSGIADRSLHLPEIAGSSRNQLEKENFIKAGAGRHYDFASPSSTPPRRLGDLPYSVSASGPRHSAASASVSAASSNSVTSASPSHHRSSPVPSSNHKPAAVAAPAVPSSFATVNVELPPSAELSIVPKRISALSLQHSISSSQQKDAHSSSNSLLNQSSLSSFDSNYSSSAHAAPQQSSSQPSPASAASSLVSEIGSWSSTPSSSLLQRSDNSKQQSFSEPSVFSPSGIGMQSPSASSSLKSSFRPRHPKEVSSSLEHKKEREALQGYRLHPPGSNSIH